MELRDLILVLFLTVVKGSSDVRSSLTFVIDDTGSMRRDIDQVKQSVNDIFDTVMNSNSSQIEDFVIVTFNDPGTYLRVKTKDRVAFKDALSRIRVHGGGTCPELAMEGIEMGLQESREGSLIYVYTDASAKDHDKFPRVEALGQKKRSQIVFVLTGTCGSRHSESYLVYPKLARATSGQVFHLQKSEINKIMAYVTKTIENRKHVLTSKAFPPGNGNTFNVTVDADTKELVISVSGSNVAVEVTNSEGTRMPTEDITRLSEVLIVNVLGVKPDVYTVELNSTTDTTVVVSGTTSVHFQHGFSVFEPSSLNDTTIKPVPGLESYVSIKLSSEGGNVLLTSVQILDMDQRVLLKKPLRIVDEGEQFYTTNETVELPDHTFLIAIEGYDVESNTYLTRVSLTPIKSQDPLLEIISAKAPLISIDGGDRINAEFNEPLQLKCQVTAYPKPDIIWVTDDSTTRFNSSEPTAVELPYVYVSILKIDKVKKNTTFTCMATNNQGTDSQSIDIVTKIEFFNILEMPNDTTIEYHEQRQIRCDVDAMPPATVYWYKGRRPLIPGENLEISANSTILTIKSMEPDLADDYICEVRNDLNRTVTPFRIDISGYKAPVINKDDYLVLAMRHSPASITCNVTEGEPKPIITWSYNYDYSSHFQELPETGETIYIEDADLEQAGWYRCLAKNVAGEDSHDIELAVEYPPVRTGVVKPRKNVNDGRRVTLHCPVSASPKPVFAWTLNGLELPETHNVYSDGTLSFTASSSDEGNYECVAKNTHGHIRLRTYVAVIVPATIEPPAHSVMQVAVGRNIVLQCPADGSPKPDITWVFNSRDPTISSRNLMPRYASGELYVSITGVNQDGFYTCKASNAGGSSNITYTIIVKAPPSIVDSVKQFTAVVGDSLVQIPCTASGNPKPDISWSKDGYNLASGSPWYEIVDGSLKIKNIDTDSAGTYVCTATNKLGSDSENFMLEVALSPDPGFLADALKLEEGASKSIDCPIPHQKTDRLRWYKDGNLLPNEPLNLSNVTENDAGVYTCRISGFAGAQTRSIKVEVVSKPKFIADANRNINYESGNYASMDCGANGLPAPEVAWLKDGTKIDFTGFIYEFEMTSTDDMGRYTCVVSNTLGSIQRDFDISPQECVLDTASDFDGNGPLMLTQYWEFTNFENIDGFIHIPKDENIILACPGEFERIPRGDLLVTCVNDKQFSYEGRPFSYAELKCRDKIEPTVSRTGRVCGRTLANSEDMRVGFAIGERFVDVYEVCVDKATNKTLYTKQNIQPYLANELPEQPIEWFNDGPPVDLDGLYDCEYQNNRISSILRMDFHKRDGCCFAKRQLVDSRNVPSGLAQAATYTHLNVAPYWGTCNTKNWEEVEQRIRTLVRSADHELQVWSGTTQELELLDAYNGLQNIKLSDRGKQYQVAKYFWKVIQDPVSKSSLAIIQVNVPDLTLRPKNYILCRDVCSDVSWMRNRRWRNPARGLTYCCSLQEFLGKFRVANVFHGYRKLLKTVSSLPSESSALHVI